MVDAAELAGRARECLGAAEMLAGRFPLQSMEMMARAVETALRACCKADCINFDAGDDPCLMARFVPEEAWAGASRQSVLQVMESCAAWARHGRADGDFRVALESDMETAGSFLDGMDEWLEGRRRLPAAA